VGDTVNVASRLESLTAQHGVPLLVAGSTRERLRHVPGDLHEVGELAIRGRGGRISAWTVSQPGQQTPEDALEGGLAGGVRAVGDGEHGD